MALSNDVYECPRCERCNAKLSFNCASQILFNAVTTSLCCLCLRAWETDPHVVSLLALHSKDEVELNTLIHAGRLEAAVEASQTCSANHRRAIDFVEKWLADPEVPRHE